jgi:hypothetical protein
MKPGVERNGTLGLISETTERLKGATDLALGD